MSGTPAPRAAAPRRSVRIAAYALGAVLVFGLVETTLAVLPSVAGEELRSVVYRPPAVTREAFDRYLAIRDPVIGWPSPGASGGRVVPRPSPAFPGPGEPCVTSYGDSMVFGDEVSDAEAWGDVLARRLACPVGNFGVGGYGTDQALLRFAANEGDRAPVTVVGIFADNLLRNVNQYRHFLTGAEPLSLKPRFVLDGAELKLVAIPVSSYEGFAAGLRRPDELFRHETFLPNSPHGPASWSFPFTASFLRLFMKDRVLNFVRGRPSWIDFFDPAHDSRALPTTIAIAEAFARRARERGKTMVIILFPSRTAYDLTRRTGKPAYANLVAGLEARGIAVRDLTADFAGHLGERAFCSILTEPERCQGHYGAEGNRLVARAIHRQLAAAGLVGGDPDRP